jgi:hypothetical protein
VHSHDPWGGACGVGSNPCCVCRPGAAFVTQPINNAFKGPGAGGEGRDERTRKPSQSHRVMPTTVAKARRKLQTLISQKDQEDLAGKRRANKGQQPVGCLACWRVNPPRCATGATQAGPSNGKGVKRCGCRRTLPVRAPRPLENQ